ncbi:prolyl endopeptidase-like [Babylonia areolata]|uniref:prolyl endopeptidase-like n=1 Tax=Babylonia areolata TaxID=304850 RepID=UPI003FCF8EFA
MGRKLTYPDARRDESVAEDYHGTTVADPYRWMEDPDAEEVKTFVDAQNALSIPYIRKCTFKCGIGAKVTERWDYPKYGCPKKRGEKYYYFHNTGLENQSVLYVQDTLDSEPKVFFDPNKLSTKGTVSLRSHYFSEDGSMWAYSLSESGSDWITIKFKKAPSSEDLPDELKNVKFTSLAWTMDNKGLFYNRYPETEGKSDGTETTSNLHHKLYYHRLGTDQSEDILAAEMPEHPRWMIGAELSDCGRYLILSAREGCDPVNSLYYTDLHALENGITGKLPYVKVVDNFEAEYSYVYNVGTKFIFKTNKDAPLYKLITIDFANPDPENWVTLIEEDAGGAVLEWATCVNYNKLVVGYLHDVKSELFIHDLETGAREYQFPLDVGFVSSVTGRFRNTEVFLAFTSYLTPNIIYHLDMTQLPYNTKVFRETKVKGFEPDKFETVQEFYTSKDGTRIPMFLVHKKGLERTGNHPVMLYGYGGFSISITPFFSPARTVFLQHMGGIYAVANIRGGSEYGDDWHKGGNLAKKQNVFDDFQAAAEYLIENKYTRPQKITINGASNGGLLVAACLNQRPDLFASGIAQVGVLDMLRFHKFTIGHAWTSDFGCSEKEEEFKWLIKYSPLHNIPKDPKGGQYPAILLMTGDHDDRVVPLHSLKFIAELQHTVGKNPNQTNPLLIRVDTDSGHGAGKPTTKVIEEISEMYSFIGLTLGLKWLP